MGWEDPTAELVAKLRALTDDQLAEAERAASLALLESARAHVDYDSAVEDPVFGLQWAFAVVIQNEQARRRVVLSSLEVDMAGGHRVVIVEDLGTYYAVCDNQPGTDCDPCWEGPDRTHIEDAFEDGRRHHPGHEPVVNGPDVL